jgi:hypothetical protein
MAIEDCSVSSLIILVRRFLEAPASTEHACRRRMMNHTMTPAIKPAPRTPPTMPPAIVVGLGLLLKDEVNGAGEDVMALPVVGVETMEAAPVISGRSVTVLRIHERRNRGRNYTQPTSCAVEIFQLSPGYKDNQIILARKNRAYRGTYNRVEECPFWYSCTRWDSFKEPDR